MLQTVCFDYEPNKGKVFLDCRIRKVDRQVVVMTRHGFLPLQRSTNTGFRTAGRWLKTKESWYYVRPLAAEGTKVRRLVMNDLVVVISIDVMTQVGDGGSKNMANNNTLTTESTAIALGA
jgi:hypothetical protein